MIGVEQVVARTGETVCGGGVVAYCCYCFSVALTQASRNTGSLQW